MAGHKVTFGVANPGGGKSEALRAEIGGDAVIKSVSDALSAGDVVVMAVPGSSMDQTITEHASELDGKIIIDAANRLGGSGPANSFATFREKTPNAQIYRAFDTLGWENFVNPDFGGVQADLFFCGPDGEGRQVVEEMISNVGLRPVYVGGPEDVGIIHSMLRLWFALAVGQGYGRHLAFKVLTK